MRREAVVEASAIGEEKRGGEKVPSLGEENGVD